MMRRLAILFLLLTAAPALGEGLVSGVSQDLIQITSNYTGSDIVVVVKGPADSIIVREKQRIAGIWMNADSSRFRSAPAFYAVASSKPISKLVDERTAAIYELGVHNLQLSPGTTALPDKARRFEAGLLDLRERNALYSENPKGVEISGGVLYRATISIPSQVPVGTYTAETFLVDDRQVVAAATRDIEIGKSGFERFVALAARRHSALYGLFAVLLSLGLGWSAAAAFRRRF
jgi:uncharacterized protein (TIGR02186 family)